MNPISLQLWTLNENTGKDFAGTVKEVARIGYRAVELAGTGNLKPAEAARAIEDAGLKVSGMHLGEAYLTEKFDELLEWSRLFKTNEIIWPGTDAKRYASKAASLEFGELLNQLGAKVRAAGLKLSWHNHDKEYALFDGRTAMEWIFEAAEPRNLSAEVDLFWVAAAGQDPLQAVKRLGNRVRMLHVKDGIDRQQTDVGQGKVNFPAIFDYVEQNGITEWYVVEQEQFTGTRMDAVRAAYAYLKSLGKS